MIRINRTFPAPSKLSSEVVEQAKDSLRIIAQSGRAPNSKDFTNNSWGHKTVRNKLWKMQHKKCCYCERMREVNRESDIEHFRPKSEIEETKDDWGYWWLAYDWNNLFFSCRYCNQEYKKMQFPLIDENSRVRSENASLDSESNYLIDPTKDDPETLIGYDWQLAYSIMVFPYGLDAEGRGTETIRITGLDRTVLNEDRASLVITLRAIVASYYGAMHTNNEMLLSAAIKDIMHETSSKVQYTAFKRAFFRGAGLGEYVSDD